MHRGSVFELTKNEMATTFEMLKDTRAWMDSKYQPDGYNVGWNCKAVGGQTVMHAHLHVIPRFAAEPLTGKGIRSLLKSERNNDFF